VLLALAVPAQAADDYEPPVAGMPAHFNGAAGTFRVSASADPVELQAEDPLTYTVRVSATGPVKRPPSRPRLLGFPAFTESFYVEDAGPPEGTRPDERTWEFAYRLKPKGVEVRAVPRFPFVFHNPRIFPPTRGYQTVYVPEVPLTVRPREQDQVGHTPPPLDAPHAAFALAAGPDVLRREGVGRVPGLLGLALLLLAPPAACVAWYAAWRRLYPDAARQAQRRRSRAAQEALRALRRGGAGEADERVRHTAGVVVRYLHNRLGLRARSPTPSEVAIHLRGEGIDGAVAEQAEAFFRACDAARFGPSSHELPDLGAAAERLILTLEGQPCSP
jgi:hypothetical protein